MTFPIRLSFCVLYSFAVSAGAAAPVVTITTDRPDALYNENEEVTFTIKAKDGTKNLDWGNVDWTLSLDGYKTLSSGKGSLDGGAGVPVKGALEHPGFLLLTATFTGPDGKKISGYAGAGVSPNALTPSLPAPDDFDAFWAEQKKQLGEVPITYIAAPRSLTTPGDAGIEAFDVQVPSEKGGAPVSGYFAKPKTAPPKSLPAVLWVHGAGVRSASLPAALGGARDGFLSMDINAHGIPNGEPEAYYKALSEGKLKTYRSDGTKSRDEIYFRGMFVRLARALDFLTTRPEWDGKTLAVIGHSQGGYQALVAGGLDERVTFIGAGVPAGCDHTGMKVNRISGWPKIVPLLADGTPDPQALEASRYVDAVNFATRCKAEAIVSVGFIDRTCPPTSVYTAYNVLQGSKKILNYPAMGHASTDEIRQKFREALLKHAGRKVEAPAAVVK
ncbi:MAG: acetylxylan esterase [Verrucomicrobiales bacterium]|nr:acetylxylan esterase [Verrucomicrobiales bacterium]